MPFPLNYTAAIDGPPGVGTPAKAEQLNNLERAVGIIGEPDAVSHDHRIAVVESWGPHAGLYDLIGAAAGVQGNLNTHAELSTLAHGGIVADADPRLSDARTPLAHGHAWGDVSKIGSNLTDIATRSHSSVSDLDYAHAGHTGFEPTVTKGNLSAGSTKITIGGTGAGALIGAGATVDVDQSKLDHSAVLNLDYAHAGHTGFEPTVTKGNLSAGSSKVSIGGTGAGALIGVGASVDVAEANLTHNNIGGLTAGDSHTQYTKIAGRAGGQSQIGGTASGENLYFESTSNVTKGKVGVKDGSFYVNVDYASGDEDATLDFNNGQGVVRWDQVGDSQTLSPNVRIDHKQYGMKVFSANADFNDYDCWLIRRDVEYDYASWTINSGPLGVYRAGMTYSAWLNNKLNHATPELAVYGGAIQNLWANSKAPTMVYDAVSKTAAASPSPAAGAGLRVLYCGEMINEHESTDWEDGSGAVVGAFTSFGGLTLGKRMWSAFLARGNAGWKYPFMAVDTDDTNLFFVDQYGRLYAKDAIGLGVTPSSSYTVYAYKLATNIATRSAFYGIEIQKVTAGGTYTTYGYYAGIYSAIDSGVTNSGSIRGLQLSVFRSGAGGSYVDSGTLTSLYCGLWAYGHQNNPATSNPITTNVHGLLLTPYIYRGRIDNLFGIYIQNPSTISTPSDWAHGDYVAGNLCKPTVSTGYWYVCSTAGHSGASEPSPWNTTPGETTADNAVTWTTLIIPSITAEWPLYQVSTTGKNYFGSPVGIGSNILDASALLTMVSTTKGFLPPRQTTTQRNAIGSPAEGLWIANTTLHTMDFYDGAVWKSIYGSLIDRGDPAAVDWSSLTTDAAAHDLNCTAVVPAGARFIRFAIELQNTASVGSFAIWFRKKGNSNWINAPKVHCNYQNELVKREFEVPCSSGRIVEYIGSNVAFSTCNLTVIAWVM